MALKKNAARVAVKAKPCQKTTIVRWIPALLIEGEPLDCGITQSVIERLPGSFATSREALIAAVRLLPQRPEAIGATAKKVEVAA